MAIRDDEWGRMLEQLVPSLFGLAGRLVDRSKRTSVVRQTVFEAWRDRHEFRGDSETTAAAFVRQILRRNAADQRRAFQRKGRLEVPFEEATEHASGPSVGYGELGVRAENQAGRLERIIALLTALEELPENERDVVVLRHFEGHTLVEIAKRFDRSYETVKRECERAEKKLRKLLETEPTS